MINTKELDKLEGYLKKNNYNYERLKVYSGEQINVFDTKNTISWDVIINEYSYGHENGLLEIMSSDSRIVDHNSHEDGVEGFLDADTIINRLESTGQSPTYGDIYEMWTDSLGSRPYDYRPVSPIFLEDTGVDIKITNPNGIIVWLENGDKIIYYPNLEKEK